MNQIQRALLEWLITKAEGAGNGYVTLGQTDLQAVISANPQLTTSISQLLAALDRLVALGLVEFIEQRNPLVGEMHVVAVTESGTERLRSDQSEAQPRRVMRGGPTGFARTGAARGEPAQPGRVLEVSLSDAITVDDEASGSLEPTNPVPADAETAGKTADLEGVAGSSGTGAAVGGLMVGASPVTGTAGPVLEGPLEVLSPGTPDPAPGGSGPDASGIAEETPTGPPPNLGTKLDVRRDRSENVCLDADKYAEALADVLRNAQGETSISLMGHWGRGKTFLAEEVERALAETHSCVRFSAWRYRTKPELWIHLYEAFRARAQEACWWDAVPRAFRAALFRHGAAPIVLGVFSLALAAAPLASLLSVLIPLAGVIGITRAAFLLRKSRHSLSSLGRRYFDAPSHHEKLGLQASLADDLTALVHGWTGRSLGWGRGKRALVAGAYVLSILLLLLALWGGLKSPTAGTWWGDLALTLPDAVRVYPPAELLWTLLGLVTFAAVAAPGWLLTAGGENARILLVVDDLDRVSGEEMLDIVESLKLFLEDETLAETVQTLLLFEESAFRAALLGKYKSLLQSEGGEYSEDRIVDENSQKLFLASLRLPPLNSREQRDLLRNFLALPKVTEQEVQSLEADAERAAQAARLRGGAETPHGVDAHIAEAKDPETQELRHAARRQALRLVDETTPDAPRATYCDAVLSDQEKESLLDALETLSQKSVANHRAVVGPRAIQSFLLRYQLARRLLQAREFAVHPAKLAEALAARLGGEPATTDPLTQGLAMLEGPALTAVLDEVV